MTSRRVGFIGLGNMGGRMTRRLAGAGYEVLGYDPVAGKAEAAGAIPADSVAAVVTGSDCVLMSLPDSSIIEPVVLGPAGVLASCRPGQVIVDLSTAGAGFDYQVASGPWLSAAPSTWTRASPAAPRRRRREP